MTEALHRTAGIGRVAILTPYPPPSRPGGVEVFTEQLAAALSGARVFAPAARYAGPSMFLLRSGFEGAARAIGPSRLFREDHSRDPYDVVIANGICGWPLSLSPVDIPTVEVYHFTLAGLARNALPLRGDRLTTGRIGGFFDRLAGRGKRVVAVSESVRREVAALYGHEAMVLPNGVDVNRFRRQDRDAARERLGLPRDTPIGLFVGRAEFAKGFDRVQAVAQSMEDVTFISTSHPSSEPGNLRFVAGLPHDRMPLLYAAADVFLLPSRYEGFNLSLLEALACEVPVVTSRAAYPFGAESPPMARVVDPPTREGFVRAIREAMAEGSRAGVRARIVREYSLEAFRRRWTELVRSLTEEGRHP